MSNLFCFHCLTFAIEEICVKVTFCIVMRTKCFGALFVVVVGVMLVAMISSDLISTICNMLLLPVKMVS